MANIVGLYLLSLFHEVQALEHADERLELRRLSEENVAETMAKKKYRAIENMTSAVKFLIATPVFELK